MISNKKLFIYFVLCFVCELLVDHCVKSSIINKYEPTWESLDERPLPAWYDQAKFGIFIHWGVFSVPSFGSEWFWHFWKIGRPEYEDYMKQNFPPSFTYQDFAKDFTAEFFDPNQWADLFKNSGAKYVVLTSKHHEGYTLWPSEFSFSWNAKDVGPHRDLVGELANAIRNRTKIHFGLYHSFFEWFNPMFLADQSANFSRNNFVLRKVIPEMMELVNIYKPEVFWSDGAGDNPVEYWQSKEFLAWLYNESPVRDIVVVNDRWGANTSCLHGGFYSCSDRYNPGVLQKHKWENAMTIDKHSWGFRRNSNLEDYLTTPELLNTLTETVSCGGNLLMNIGPTKEGTIAPIFQERLLDMGKWLTLNGESIFETTPWTHQNDTLNSDIWYTSKKKTVYAIFLKWPKKNILEAQDLKELLSNNKNVTVTLLENNNKLAWNIVDKKVQIDLGDKALTKNDWAWVAKITNFEGFSFEYK